MLRPTDHPTSHVLAALTVTLTFVSGLVGCDVDYHDVDPDIVLADAEDGTSSGDPYAELGFYFTDSYTKFDSGDGLPVVHGLQGGMWTMPVIRTKGLGSFATVECSLITDAGEQVGYTRSKTKFFLSPDGWYEALNFPIPVYHPEREADPIDDLYGQMSTLECTVIDKDERQAGFTIALEIVQG